MIDWIIHNYETIGGIAATIVGVYGLWKKVIAPQLRAAEERFQDYLEERLDESLAELRHNGGSSMKDQVSQLVDSMAVLHAIVYSTWDRDPTPHFVCQADGHCLYVNPAYCDLVKRPPQVLYGGGWAIVVHPEDRESVTEDWYDAVATNRLFDRYFRYVDSDGETVPVHVIAEPIYNPTGKQVGFIGTVAEHPVPLP